MLLTLVYLAKYFKYTYSNIKYFFNISILIFGCTCLRDFDNISKSHICVYMKVVNSPLTLVVTRRTHKKIELSSHLEMKMKIKG